MIRNIFNCTVLAALLAMTSCSAGQSQENGGFNDPTAFSTHESFRTIRNWFEDPSDMKLAVYWYWINDNISEEGVKKDLQAMKEVGINRAFIGNVTADLPWGDVKMFTPEWWKVTHAALKEASRLGIEIGIFNSPGWSQSGGPWVKPEQSMRYLDCADLTVDATGGPLTVKLPEVAPDAMEDVRIIAYPAMEARSDTKRIVKQEGTPITLDFKCEEGAYRTLTITPIPETKIITNVTVTCGGDTLRRFLLDRSNPDVQVGYLLYAPVVIGLPEGCTGTYTVAFSEEGQGTLDVSFSTRPLLERYAEKSLGKMFQTPLPMWDAYLW
ncbi:MAG: glycoside hydrolase family 2, partial [Bacteroidales bacterium]|nr:glycoside hydrolase family 2 [Bacteroidales bacterium]